MSDKEYGHVCCPNCGMVLVFTTEVPSNANFENSIQPPRKEKIFYTSKEEFISMSAQVAKDVRGEWSRVYKYKPKSYFGWWAGLNVWR